MLVIGPHRVVAYLRFIVGADSISARKLRVSAGVLGTPPPTYNRMGVVGANIVRPLNLA